jgi:hypothetical protein
VDVAVTKSIKSQKNSPEVSALQALTAAALFLPGLIPITANAVEEAEFSFSYGRYQEGERQITSIDTITNPNAPTKVSVPQLFKPIEADSLAAGVKTALTDRIRFNANFSQDTWAGATPVASAPAIFGANSTNEYISNGTVTGASPLISTPAGIYIFDKQLRPLGNDISGLFLGGLGATYVDPQITHTMAMASPETRKQGDFSISYEWDDAAVSVGGGISSEHDYESRFYNLGGRLDFNRKLTSLDYGLSYTNSTTSAFVDHHADSYFIQTDRLSSADIDQYGFSLTHDDYAATRKITGRRQDWGFNLGLTQILNKNAFIKLGGTYTLSDGYMSNPYKGVTTFVIDENETANYQAMFGNDVLGATTATYFERRPLERNQFNWDARFVQHIEPLDASVHLGYRFFHDDWGINAHTFDADWVQSIGSGWSLTPRIRYYSQSEADFYAPYLVLTNSSLPAHFSSDHRLSGFGAVSGGISLKKELTKGVSLEAGFDYYTHQGALKLGGGGEAPYADFDFYTVNGALNVNMSALGRGVSSEHHHHHEHGAPLPSGVMFGHMLNQSNDVMVGYRYQYNLQAGGLLQGDRPVSDTDVVANACGNTECYVAPYEMAMHMHMLDLMYAPTDWLTLMLMPQFMDMSMDMKSLQGSPVPPNALDAVGTAVAHTKHEHITGGIGDTGIYAMFKLLSDSKHHVHVTAGFTAPTGESDIGLRRAHQNDMGYIHYGMQVGSGTWDFKPSLTYTGQWDQFSWGAQFNATMRTGNNNAGFTFGDELQGTAWGGYKLTDWLNSTVRGIYTDKGTIRGGYPEGSHVPVGSMDYTQNYGGRYWDLGVGINAVVPSGDFAGNTFSVEWQQPLLDDVNGYQREREGALAASWSYMF